MKRLIIALLSMLVVAVVTPTFAQSKSTMSPSTQAPGMHRYLIKRTFAPGALAGLDQATKDKVNATNAKYRVKWVRSYATADKTMTFCVYEAPSELAVRDAAKANGLPIDQIFQVPVTLMPNSQDVVSH